VADKLKPTYSKLLNDINLYNLNVENIKKHIKLTNTIHFLSKFGSGMNFFKQVLKNKYIRKFKNESTFLE
jgi:hypothetical protein